MYLNYLTKCDYYLKETLCVFCFVVGVSCSDEVTEKTSDKPIFTSLQEVLDIIQIQQARKNPEAEMLLYLYEHRCLYNPHNFSLPTTKRKPFIEIEGNHYPTRAILSKKLARSMNAIFLPNPPRCFFNLKRHIRTGHPLHKEFMVLSTYVTAFKAALFWRERTIITNSYYAECIAMTITRMIDNNSLTIPNSSAAIYKWPDDLVPPDISFFINFPDDVFFPEKPVDPSAWKVRISEAYRHMFKGEMFEINTKIGLNSCLVKMEAAIVKRFASQYNFDIAIPVSGRRDYLKSYRRKGLKQPLTCAKGSVVPDLTAPGKRLATWD